MWPLNRDLLQLYYKYGPPLNVAFSKWPMNQIIAHPCTGDRFAPNKSNQKAVVEEQAG